MANNFLSANISSLELLQPFDEVFGYDINRLTAALSGLRSGEVTLVGPTIETNTNPTVLGGVLIDNSGIKVIADGTHGIPIGTVVWNSQTTGQFTTAQFFPVYGGYQQVDGTYRARVRFFVPATITSLVKVLLSFTLQPFHVAQQTTGTANTSVEGSQHHHNISVEGSQHHHNGVGIESGHNHGHDHTWNIAGPAGAAGQLWTNGTSVFSTVVGANIPTTSNSNGSTGHSHGFSDVEDTTHVHAADVEDLTHVHAIPSMSLTPPAAIYEAGMAQGVHVWVDNGSGLNDQTTPLGGPWGGGSAMDVSNLDVTPYITGNGWKEMQLSSTTIGGITPQIIFQWIGTAI